MSREVYCFELHCIVLQVSREVYCFISHCIVLQVSREVNVLYCIVLQVSREVYCFVLHCIVLQGFVTCGLFTIYRNILSMAVNRIVLFTKLNSVSPQYWFLSMKLDTFFVKKLVSHNHTVNSFVKLTTTSRQRKLRTKPFFDRHLNMQPQSWIPTLNMRSASLRKSNAERQDGSQIDTAKHRASTPSWTLWNGQLFNNVAG